MAEEANAGCNESDMPTSAWPGKARKVMWNHFYLGIAIDERHPLLGAPRAVVQRSTAMKAATRYCQMDRGE